MLGGHTRSRFALLTFFFLNRALLTHQPVGFGFDARFGLGFAPRFFLGGQTRSFLTFLALFLFARALFGGEPVRFGLDARLFRCLFRRFFGRCAGCFCLDRRYAGSLHLGRFVCLHLAHRFFA